ncbi:hypothetical protein AB5I41_30325 [Sphingomonas sp. MMS24-JH45]
MLANGETGHGGHRQYRQDDKAAEFRFRHDGWTPKRQHEFLSKLRESGCVRDACKWVGLSSTSAYRLRARLPEFAASWDAALALALPRLEQAAFAGARRRAAPAPRARARAGGRGLGGAGVRLPGEGGHRRRSRIRCCGC